MKRILLTFFCFAVAATTAFAQNQKPQPHWVCDVKCVEHDFLFRNYPNRLIISVPGLPNNVISIEVSPNVSARQVNGLWIVTPTDSCGKTCNINVYALINGKKQTMGTRSFRIKTLPAPAIRFSNGQVKYGGSDNQLFVPIEDLLDPKFSIRTIDNPSSEIVLGVMVSIKGFTVRFNDGEEITCKGCVFNQSVRDKIKDLPSQSIIIIKSILAVDRNDKPVEVSPVVLIATRL